MWACFRNSNKNIWKNYEDFKMYHLSLCRFFWVIVRLLSAQYSLRLPEAEAAPNRFRPKPRVPNLVGHLPRVSYVCLVGQSLKGRWWGWRWNGANIEGSATDFLAKHYDWGKPRKTSVRKPYGALSSVTSHCFKWGPFPPNEVGRATLSAPLAKPIGPSHKSLLKNLRSGIRRSRDFGNPKI